MTAVHSGADGEPVSAAGAATPNCRDSAPPCVVARVRGPAIELRAPLLHLPNYAVTAFGERLDRHGTEPGFVAVLAYADGHSVGYVHGNTIEHGDRYWQRTSPALRKTGTARQIHLYASGRTCSNGRRPSRPAYRRRIEKRIRPRNNPPTSVDP